jgi:hypothetical protein
MFKTTTDEDLMPEGTKVRRLSYYLKTREERDQINAGKHDDLIKDVEASPIELKA